MINAGLDAVVAQLTTMVKQGHVTLRLSPRRTALAIAALKDGLAWLTLARDQPLAELQADLLAVLDCLIIGR